MNERLTMASIEAQEDALNNIPASVLRRECNALRAALRRLASAEAFTRPISLTPGSGLSDELRARMDYAAKAAEMEVV